MNKIPMQFTDQIIYGFDVQIAMAKLKGDAWRQALKDLEQLEPALGACLSHAADTIGFHLHAQGCSRAIVQETEEFFVYAMLVICDITRTAHRRLGADFMPSEDDVAIDHDAGEASNG